MRVGTRRAGRLFGVLVGPLLGVVDRIGSAGWCHG